MPLASWYSLHFYGPQAMAAVGTATPSADAEAFVQVLLEGVGTSLATSPSAALTNGRKMEAVGISTASSPNSLLSVLVKLGAIGKIGELSQADVTGAVLEEEIEDGLTMRQALRILLAVAAGKTTINDLGGGAAEVTFRDINDLLDRVVADMAGSERTTVTLDPN